MTYYVSSGTLNSTNSSQLNWPSMVNGSVRLDEQSIRWLPEQHVRNEMNLLYLFCLFYQSLQSLSFDICMMITID